MSQSQEVIDKTVKVYDRKGRTVLPKDVRNALGIEPGDEWRIVGSGESFAIMKAEEQSK